MDHRVDLWDNLSNFRDDWEKMGKICTRISGTNYLNKQNVLNEFIINNRINLNGNGFRNNKTSFLGELGCYKGHYDCWKYVVDNKLETCLILEDGITIVRNDFNNVNINKNIEDLLFINEEMKMDGNKNFIGYGLQGYIVTLKCAEILLNLCLTLNAPIDLQVRHLCNSKEISASCLTRAFVKRNNDRISSIDGFVSNYNTDLNAKQNMQSIIQRLIMNLLKNNVNLDDYV
jgi:GR25 family glycosyltransferase involved in LPS biosynthesis